MTQIAQYHASGPASICDDNPLSTSFFSLPAPPPGAREEASGVDPTPPGGAVRSLLAAVQHPAAADRCQRRAGGLRVFAAAVYPATRYKII